MIVIVLCLSFSVYIIRPEFNLIATPPNWILFSIVVTCFIILSFLLAKEKIVNWLQRFCNNQIFDIVIISFFALLATHIWWRSGFPITHDGDSSVIVMDIVLKASKNDANFALWNPYYGIGTPFFQFLSLFSYYVILPFSLFGLKPYQIIKAGVILFFILAAISMYFSVKLLSKKRLQAIFASSFYIFSGYILLNANYRNAIEELFGLILVPIILSTYIKALSNAESNYAIISGMFLSLLVLTHIPTTYTVFVAVSICTIFILMKDRHKKSIFKTISIYIMFILVGIGLSSWWILPILNNINSLSYASSSEFLRNYVSHLSPIWRLMVREQWFGLQTSPWMPLYIGNVTIVLATLSFLDKRTKINDFFIVLFTISLIFSFSIYFI